MTGTNGLARAMIWLVSQVASPLAKPSSAAGVLPGHAQHPQVVRPPGQVTLRTDAEMLELAAALKREKPGRTAAQGGAILRAHCAAGDVRPVRGIPRTSAEMRAAARLGIKITHSTTGRPRDPGEIKRFFRAVQEQSWSRSRRHRRGHPGRPKHPVHRLDRNRLPRPVRPHDQTGRPPLRSSPPPWPAAGGILVIRAADRLGQDRHSQAVIRAGSLPPGVRPGCQPGSPRSFRRATTMMSMTATMAKKARTRRSPASRR